MRQLIITFLEWLLKRAKGANKDREWQILAEGGAIVAAIKRHREIYGSGLKEAHEAVTKHMSAKGINRGQSTLD